MIEAFAAFDEQRCPRCDAWSPKDHDGYWCLNCGTWGDDDRRAWDPVAPPGRSRRSTFRPWSAAEDAFLAAKLGSGMSVAAIADRLKRTERAVWSRLSIKGWSRRGRQLTKTAH